MGKRVEVAEAPRECHLRIRRQTLIGENKDQELKECHAHGIEGDIIEAGEIDLDLRTNLTGKWRYSDRSTRLAYGVTHDRSGNII
jgi:hypothetical protein